MYSAYDFKFLVRDDHAVKRNVWIKRREREREKEILEIQNIENPIENVLF